MIRNFYVMAIGRSGTTLLANILDAHPNMVVPPESFFILHLERKYGKTTFWDARTIKKFIDDVYVDRPFRLMWKVPREVVERCFESLPPVQNFNEACNRIRMSYNASFATKDIKLIGDKHPIYSNFSQRMMRINPEAKIIHMVRDPRGTGSGQITTFKRKDALGVGYLWARYNNNLLELQNLYPEKYFLLKYEDLIQKPEETVQRVCEFLEIPFHPQMMDYRKEMVERFDDYTHAITKKHQSLLQPIDPKMAEKWRTKLSEKQIAQIEFATYQTASRLGYQFEKPAMPKSESIKYSISQSKVKVILGIVTLFFNFPFLFRKMILGMKSIALDHKYKN